MMKQAFAVFIAIFVCAAVHNRPAPIADTSAGMYVPAAKFPVVAPRVSARLRRP